MPVECIEVIKGNWMKKGDSIAMQKQRSLTANFIMNTILSISSFVFPLLTFPYISRILQPAGIGKISFATSVVSYFAMFAQMGIPTYGIRACAKVRDDREELSRTVHELFFINLGMSLVSYVALFFVIFYIPRLRQEKELFLIISLTIILNTVGMEWVYKASERYTYITVRSIVFKFIAFVAYSRVCWYMVKMTIYVMGLLLYLPLPLQIYLT